MLAMKKNGEPGPPPHDRHVEERQELTRMLASKVGIARLQRLVPPS